MTTVSATLQKAYFDRQKVIKQLGRKKANALKRAGAFIRRRARSSLRPAPKRARREKRSGLPPRIRAKGSRASLKNIQYGLADDRESIVIGPVLLPNRKPKGSSAATVPELLTKGGTARLDAYSNGGDVWNLGTNPQAAHRRTVNATYDPHPFMGPALDKERAAGTLDAIWS
jgi:hypothetical protein